MSKQQTAHPYTDADDEQNRWRRIQDADDIKTLWQGIDWNGRYRETDHEERPSEAAFQDHLERLLNPGDTEVVHTDEFSEQVSLASLDDPFAPDELLHVIDRQIKPHKGSGPDGISPGVLTILPINWLAVLLFIINLLFLSGIYPLKWTLSKLNMLYKKGPSMNCGNYRGISVINSLAKCYDYLLNNRLTKWFIPSREQAGAQKKRGCIEHIVTLRLIIDRCMRLRSPLFIAFVDFSKAYDRVPRSYLLTRLRQLGCGKVMLIALASMYCVTHFCLCCTKC